MTRNLFLLMLVFGLAACGGSRSSSTSGNGTDSGGGPTDSPIPSTNQAPVANDDLVAVPVNASIMIDVLANDTDPDGDELTIIIVNPPAHGTAALDTNGTSAASDDRILYQPFTGYSGADEFSYELSDGSTGTASGRVRINVGGTVASDRNQATADDVTTETGSPIVISVLDNDVSVGIARITMFTQAAHGVVSLDDAGTVATDDDRLVYAANAGFAGLDSFVYMLNDDSPAAVTVTVNDSGAGIYPTPAPVSLSGRIVKGPVANALVTLYPMDAAGNEDRGTPAYQTVTDADGYWYSPLPVQPVHHLVVSAGGEYFDESQSAATPLAITFAATEELTSVLPAGERFAVTSVYSSALYSRSSADASGANFSAVMAQMRTYFASALGFDVIATDPADPAAPNIAASSVDAVAYALLLGGAAESINVISSALGLSGSDYPVVMATIDDLTDCWLDGEGIRGPVSVAVGPTAAAMPDNVNLNTQTLRFKNNRAGQYAGATLAQIDKTPCELPGALPDATAPVFTTLPPPLIISTAGAAGIPVGTPAIVAFLAAAAAVDDVDGAVAVSNDAPAVLSGGNTMVTFFAVDSAGNASSATQTIAVNTAPAAIVMDNSSISENMAIGSVVGNLSSVDPDVADTHLYTLVAGAGDAGNTAFSIAGNTLRANAAFDFESQSSWTVRVQSQDQAGGSVTGILTITILDANDGPGAISLDTSLVSENLPAGTTIGSLATADQDTADTHSYTLVAGAGDADNAAFTISGTSLNSAAPYDFESRDSYSIRVQTEDAAGAVFATNLGIFIADANDDPTAINLGASTVDENSPVGTIVGALTTDDVDASDTHTYTLVAGSGDVDNALFTVSSGNLLTGTAIDFETRSSYSVRLQSEDAAGGTVASAFIITVNDLPDSPTAITIDSTTVDENLPSGTLVGNLSAADDGDGDTVFSLIAGPGDSDNALFAVSANTLVTGAVFDFEAGASFSVRLHADDDGATFAVPLTITINDVNEGPTAIALDNTAIDENLAAGTVVANLSSTDQDAGDSFTYALVAGTGDSGNGQFTIVGSQLVTAAIFDFETLASYPVRLATTDSGGIAIASAFVISINNANDAPSALSLDSSVVNENQPVGTLVANLSSTDVDAGDTFAYSLVAGSGDTDNGQFTVAGNQLLTGALFDYETAGSYSVRLQTSDSGGATFATAFTITLNDTNDDPSAISLDTTTVDENQASGTLVATLTTTDQDAGDSFSYALVSGAGDTGNAQFTISGNQLLSNAVFDFETLAAYSVRIATTDASGSTFAGAFAITVNDTNDDPTAVSLDSTMVDENQPSGIVVANLSTTDVDTGDTFTYSLASGSGDTDNAQFTIVGTQLLTGAVFDFETLAAYSVRIATTDASGSTFASAFAITVKDINDDPTAVSLDSTTVDENQPSGTVVANLSSTDVDAGDTFTYSLAAGSGDTDNSQFTVVGTQLLTSAVFDFETLGSYSVRIATTDSGSATFAAAFTITINDINDDPTAVSLDSSTVDENQLTGTLVANLASIDQDTGDSFSYALVSGAGDADNTQFTIAGSQLRTNAVFDFETLSTYSVRIETTDAGGSAFADGFTININDINDDPTALSLDSSSVDENQAAGTVVANMSTTDVDAGDSFSYALVAGAGDADNAQFTIVGSQLLTSAVFDFETLGAYSVRLQTSDSGGATFASAFAISVNDINDDPTAIILDSNNVDENQATGTLVANLASTDQDTGDTFTYALVSGPGDADNAQFNIIGGQLFTSAVFDYESRNSYSVRIATTDANSGTFADMFTIAINNLPEAPGDADADGLTDPEEAALVGTFAGDPLCPYANNPDSDGDMIGDGAEVRAGGNPCLVDPLQTIFYVDPTGTWPGSTTNLPPDPIPANSTVPNYVLIETGLFNSEIAPSSACNNLHYIGSQDFSQPGVINSDPSTGLPTTTIDMQNTRFSLVDGCVNMVIQDLALTNGIGDGGRGGGIRAKNSATVLLERVHIYNNAAVDQGGGIGVSNAGTVVDVSNSLIENNTVSTEKGGGGIWTGNGATLNLEFTRVHGNSALGSGGGGLYFDHGTTSVISSSWITENVASVDGGGIEIDYTAGTPVSITIEDTVIAGNSSGALSGGLRVLGDGSNTSSIAINNSQITGNFAPTNGGGVGFRDTGTSANMSNVLITGNRSGFAGAGVRVFGLSSAPRLQNLTLALNRTSDPAGGGVSAVGGNPQILDSILWQNRAGDRAFNVAPTGGDNYTGVTSSDFNLLEIDKIGASDIDFVSDGAQPFFTSAYYLDQALSPAVNTGSDTAVNLALDTYYTGAATDGGQVDRGYHYGDAEGPPADGYREIGGALNNFVLLQNAEFGAAADRLIIEPLLGGLPLGAGHQVVATLETANAAYAQIIPAANIDPLDDGESALLIDQGDGSYAADLHASMFVPSGTVLVPLRIYVDGTPLPIIFSISRRP